MYAKEDSSFYHRKLLLGTCGSLNEKGPLSSYICMSGSQVVDWLGRIRLYGLRGGVSLGVRFEVSKSLCQGPVCLSVPISPLTAACRLDVSPQLQLQQCQSCVCSHPPHHSEPSKAARKCPLNAFFYKAARVMSHHTNRTIAIKILLCIELGPGSHSL